MKRSMMIIACALMVSVLAMGKSRTIVVKQPDRTRPTTHTEVPSTSEFGDTLNVIPGSKITFLQFTLQNAMGSVVYNESVPANIKMVYILDMPDLPKGGVFTIKDNNGVVYTDYEIQ